MYKFIIIALGGAIGSVLRYITSNLDYRIQLLTYSQ